MVFPSIPSYLDSSNWTQQQSHQTGSSSTNSLLPPAPALTQPPSHAAGGGSASVRPGSMTERARLASIPLPETALKCPRCESTNTKFCYFNNYNLSQPRHFCKTCRRYWTRGGALRNVPVGGGCRRNKRNKATNTTKSPANTTEEHITTTPRVSTGMVNLPQISPGRFMSPLGFTDNFPTSDVYANFPVENNFLGGHSGEPWRLQPPFLGGFDPSPAGVYQFHGGVEQASFLGDHNMRPKLSSSMMSQLSSVKLEENSRLNLSSRQLMGSDANWTDLSSFSSPSSNNPL